MALIVKVRVTCSNQPNYIQSSKYCVFCMKETFYEQGGHKNISEKGSPDTGEDTSIQKFMIYVN